MVLCGVCDDGHPGFLHPALPLLPHRFLENWCARVRARARTHTHTHTHTHTALGALFAVHDFTCLLGTAGRDGHEAAGQQAGISVGLEKFPK